MGSQVILASSSPRRRELMERFGIAVKVIPANVDEVRLDDETAENFVKRLARAKALAVVERLQTTLYPTDASGKPIRPAEASVRYPESRWVLGADTVVVYGESILGKPQDTSAAVAMLETLSGHRHRVITGFCIHDLMKDKEGVQAVSTEVQFKTLTRMEIDKYVSVGESMDKAGAYAVQGVGAYLVDSIIGSYTNIVGLPMCQLVEMMEEMGAYDVLPYGK